MIKTKYTDILDLIDQIDPIRYGKTRNYIDGAVTKLSPYISRGVISTKQVAMHILQKGYKPYQIEQFLKELAWRDYFQQVWINKLDLIDQDVKNAQEGVTNNGISSSIIDATTGIEAIDQAIESLYQTGYMHNHHRMYLASIACNIAKSHWYIPAKWMYYHLLDADWASNALSWQWVAGSFSSKKYYANQENINKYCHSIQQGSFLDGSYEAIAAMPVPESLIANQVFSQTTQMPITSPQLPQNNLPYFVYNFYNLDPQWGKYTEANKILLLEPSFFEKYPSSNKVIDFIISLSQNIPSIQIIVGEFENIFKGVPTDQIHYKEHPTNIHYKGIVDSRDWMFPEVNGYYPSFFSYWKKCEKYIKNLT